jgi:cytochrome P450 monooxygenase
MIASAIGEVTASIIGARLGAWDARAVTILEETQAIALEIIFRVMGIRSDEMSTWRVKYQEFLLAGVPLTLDVPFSPRRRAKRARAWLDARLGAIVAATRDGQEKSLLRALIDARDERGEGLTDQELLDNLRLLALAGHETTASTMAWVAITLARRPDLCEALVKEAGAAEAIPRSPEEARAYRFAEGLFREAVRLYPPVAFTSRRMTDWVTLCHHRIAPGTLVGVPLGAIGRHPKVHPDPMRFDPGRWMGRSTPPTPIEIASFGGGHHFCLGYHFAWMEVVQFAVAFARELARREVRPSLADGPAPVLEYSPLGHPTRRTRLEFVR